LLSGAIETDPDQPRLFPAFLWAASAVATLPPVDAPLLGRIVAKIDPAKLTDSVSLARLALAKHRLGKSQVAVDLVQQAMKVPNKSMADLRELAGILGRMDRVADAVALFDGKPLAVEDRAVLAELAATARDWVNAERQYRAVLAARPDDVATTIRLADVISLKGNHDEARATLTPFLQKMPQDPALLTAAGDISLRAGDPATAVTRYEASLKARPDHLPARRGFIDAAASVEHLTPSQLMLAVQNADAVAAGAVVEPASVCRLAWVMVRHREIPRADRLLDRCVTSNIPVPAIRRELAPILAARGRGREALQVLDGLREPDDLLLFADVYASLKDFAAAIKECKAYLAARQEDPKGERRLAELLSLSGEYDEALQLFRRLRAKNPTDTALQVRTAETMWRLNRHAEAMDIFVRILGDGMTAQAALSGGPLGVVGDPSGAMVAFVAAAFESEKVTPSILQTADLIRPTVTLSTDPLLLARLGYVFYRAGRIADASSLLDRAMAIVQAEDQETRWLLGGVLTLARRRPDAARLWVGIPASPELSQRLALLYASANDHNSALLVCDDALKARPGDRKLDRLRADVLSWKGDYAAAISLLKNYHLNEPDDAELAIRLAEVHLWAKNYVEALRLSEAQLRKSFGGSKAVRVFLEAAGMSGNLTVEQADLVVACHRDLPFVAEPEEAVFAGRVGLALRAAGATRNSEAMFDRAIKDTPRDPRGRRALAGLLAIAGRPEHAFKLYDGTDPEPGDLLQLAYLNLGRKDYLAAEKAAQAYLAANPADAIGERALADILAGKGEHKAALLIFERLQAARPKDAELAIRLAEVRLASGDRSAAAVVFAQAVEERLGATGTGEPSAGLVALDARVRAGFAAAVAGIPEPAPRYVDLAAKLAKSLAPDNPDYTTAGRLGVILARAGRSADAAILADRAAKIEVKDPSARREVAGILAAVGQGRRALMLLDGLDLTTEDRLMVAGLQASVGELAAAEKTCRAAVAAAPTDDRTVRMLADVLSWNKEFKESATLYEKLLRTNPADKAIQLRLAEMQLGSGDYEAAAERFLALVSDDMPPGVAANFLAAVANVKTIRPALQKAARRVGESGAAKTSTDVGFLVNLAWVHHRCEATKECDFFLNAALALKPQDPAVRRNLSAVLEVRGRHEEALAAMDGLTFDDADHVRVAGLHLARKDYTNAEKELKAILDRIPAHPKARRLSVEVMIGRKEFTAAFDRLAALATEFPGDREIALRTAETLLADGNYEAALIRFRDLLSVEPEHPELWAGYVDAAASSKKLTPKEGELATRISEQSEKDTTRPPAFWSRLGWVLFRSNHPTKTLQLIDRALALKPTDPDVKRELAGVLSALGRNREALALYEGMELNMADKVRMTELVMAVQDFDHAEKLLDELLATDPNDRNLRRLHGNLLAWKKKYPEAIKEFEALRRENPGDLDVLTGLALATLWKGDATKALPMLHDLLISDLGQQVLWRPYLDAVGQVKTVRAQYKAVVEQLADKIEELKLVDPELFGGLGVALAKIGQSERAIVTLRRAVQLNPKSDALQFRLAETLTAAGRFADAEKMYAELLSRRNTLMQP
jgi:tetratricopeptide (TPR) repeat protein